MASRAARALPLLASLLAACSGAGNEDLFEGTSVQDNTSEADATESPPAPAGPGATTPGTTSPPAQGPTPAAPPGTGPQADACTTEAEPNNDQGKATPFTTRLCGKIDSGTDVDWGRFTLPAGTTKVSWKHKEAGGKATYRFLVNGLPVIGEQGDGELRVIAGATYTVQIRGAQGNRPSYELEITIK